jgi:dynein intermediate chain 1
MQFNNPYRERATITEPPPSVSFNHTITQGDIFDAYVEDIERQRIAKEKTSLNKKQPGEKGDTEDEEQRQKELAKDTDIVHSAPMSRSLKTVERMVNQNTFDEIVQDFRYWDDQSDSFKEGEGTLLPLWKFYTEKVRRKQVTALCWSPEYYDLFAVGYGSYDFMKQVSNFDCWM